jgi:hypothetical protein
MSTSAQDEMAERLRVFAQDQSLRTGTYLSHTHDDIHQGRFAAIGQAQVVGSSAVPQYPAAGPHQADPCGPEPPTGYRIDDMELLEQPPALPVAQGNLGDAVVAPSSGPCADDVERPASPSLSSGDPPEGSPSLQAQRGHAGSPPLRRF